jgi:hypothetical protein
VLLSINISINQDLLVQTTGSLAVRTKTRKREAGQKNKPSLLERKKEET